MSFELNKAVGILVQLGFKVIRDNVFFTTKKQVTSNNTLISALKVIAEQHPTSRARVCFHNNLSAQVQEMLIVFSENIELVPLKQEKTTTLTYVVISGEAELLQFNQHGEIVAKKFMGRTAGKSVVEKISSNIIRTIKVTSDFFVFYEITEGPFTDDDTLFFNDFS